MYQKLKVWFLILSISYIKFCAVTSHRGLLVQKSWTKNKIPPPHVKWYLSKSIQCQFIQGAIKCKNFMNFSTLLFSFVSHTDRIFKKIVKNWKLKSFENLIYFSHEYSWKQKFTKSGSYMQILWILKWKRNSFIFIVAGKSNEMTVKI